MADVMGMQTAGGPGFWTHTAVKAHAEGPLIASLQVSSLITSVTRHQRVTTMTRRTAYGFTTVARTTGQIGVVKVHAKQWKLGSATIGVSAVAAMGALGVIFGDVSSAEPAQVVGPVVPQAPTEQTITTTTPPPAPETSVASPTVTATTPSGFLPAPGP
jgi:hypothetical protein